MLEYKLQSCIQDSYIQFSEIDVVVEEDFVCRTSVSELNQMRDAINEMREENGELPLTEEELQLQPKTKSGITMKIMLYVEFQMIWKKAAFLKRNCGMVLNNNSICGII